MIAYITKYALTEGIIESKDAEQSKAYPSMLDVPHLGYVHREGRDWHRTREAALARAEVMRKNKLASLKKQIKKMEELKFT